MDLTNHLAKDENEFLKQIQYYYYPRNVVKIYRIASKMYLKSVRIVGIETELSNEINRETDECQSKAIEYVHDIIAAKFRFDHPEFEQLTIQEFEEISSDEERATQLWIKFFDAELTRLFDYYPELLREILKAEHYPPSDARGYIAENWIISFFDH
ncbi:MAG: hypothetical protein JXR56_08305, partial [Candidatus Cloacimonetes bacterium]|nr:hypothetical protein [Candidatus Cloacimonadota bacterium]